MAHGPTPPVSPYLLRIADGIPAMLAYWDADLVCRYANRAYERWFGRAPASLVGTSIRDLLGADLFAQTQPHIEAVLGGEPQTFERELPSAGDVRRHCLAHYLPDEAGGRVAGFFTHVVEVTSLKQKEEALQQAEQRFRTLSEASPFGVYHADAAGRRTYANQRWHEIFGAGAGANLDAAWSSALHPQDRDRVLAAWEETVRRGGGFDMELRVCRPDGDERTVHSRASAVRSPDGMVTGHVGAVEDITDRRRAEHRLRASEAFLDRTGRIAAVGGWEVDLLANRITWSDRTRQIHEVPPGFVPQMEQAIGFYAPEARPVINDAVKLAIEQGTPWDMELPFVTATGRPIWVRTFGEVEYDQGQPVRLVGAFQDITEHRERKAAFDRERMLRVQSERTAQELDALLRERDEMLDVMAHEVRQPLNNASAAMQSAAQVLAGMAEGEASIRLTKAQAVLGQVLASIDNTLAVAALLAGSQPVHRSDTDIDTLVSVAIADMPANERDRIAVERVTATRTASMDMSLMRLALRNLLSNALKYSPKGSPVKVRLTDSDDPLALVIDVESEGAGIEASFVPRLFDRGARGGGAKGTPGHGLGLYIVRRVMELHGGQAMLAANGPAGVSMRLVVEQSSGD